MDKIADEVVNNSNNSKHVYKMHDSNAYTLDVICVNSSNNNNNNEKMDDANQTTTTKTAAANQKFSNTMRQDSTNSDFSPLTDSMQLNGDERHSIEFRADDEYSINDNQSNTSDEASDNNSTDNISFSEDIVDNIIVLPNNFLSDDESTNSDDIVYAYRGFEPAQVNIDVNADADDETDYLEMDFEPDPASEIEQETNQSIEPSCSHIVNLSPQNSHKTKTINPSNETSVNTLSDLNIERTGVHKNWLAPIDVRHNGIYAEVDTLPLSNRTNRNTNNDEHGGANNNNKLDLNVDSIKMESNKSLETKRNVNKVEDVKNGDTYSTYYDNTVSLSTKKYTGTIPKTSKIHNRPNKSKTTTSDFTVGIRLESLPTNSMHNSLDSWPNQNNQTHKRWKISNREKPTSSSSTCDMVPIEDIQSPKRPISAARSMSFPNEDLSDQRITDGRTIYALRCQPTCELEIENDVEQSVSVTFESTYCTMDTIVNALEQIHVLPDLRILQKALRDGESTIPQMNIPEYLVYASKRYCNYKAIVAAIEQSCDDVEVKCYLTRDGPLETVNIPLRMIASRLRTNGSLSNILTIKNRRFHQMNVLGKIVNMVRRFPDMRDDLIHNEFITIPQYYRSGIICVSKKKPAPNRT